MIEWRGVLAAGPGGDKEMMTFQGRPIAYRPDDEEHVDLMGDIVEWGVVVMGADLLAMHASDATACVPCSPDAWTFPGFAAERATLHARAVRDFMLAVGGDQAPGDLIALMVEASPDKTTNRLLDVGGIPVVYCTTNPQEMELLRKAEIMQPRAIPVRWGYCRAALPCSEWFQKMKEGEQAWIRRPQTKAA